RAGSTAAVSAGGVPVVALLARRDVLDRIAAAPRPAVAATRSVRPVTVRGAGIAGLERIERAVAAVGELARHGAVMGVQEVAVVAALAGLHDAVAAIGVRDPGQVDEAADLHLVACEAAHERRRGVAEGEREGGAAGERAVERRRIRLDGGSR